MTIIPFPSAPDDAEDFYPCDVDPFPQAPATEIFTQAEDGSLAWILMLYLVGGTALVIWGFLRLLGAV